MKRFLFILCIGLLCLASCASPDTTEVTSPDGRIHLAFLLDDGGRLAYQVEVDDTLFLSPSALGFQARDGVNLSEGFRLLGTDFAEADETWHQPWGENKTLRNHYREMAVRLSGEAGVRLTLRFRVFDDGLGFRYEYDVPGVDSLLLTDELTAFRVARDGTAWSIPANFDTYELTYRTLPLSGTETANTPITFRTGGVYASIHEAALTDFPEMTLKNTGGTAFKSELAPWRRDF